MAAKATVRGDKEIIANMRRAYHSVGGAFLDKTMRQSLEPMKERTEENARPLRNFPGKHPGWPGPRTPRIGGHLDQGVIIARRESRSALKKVYWVSFTKRARKIAHLNEFGTAPHWQPGLKFMHPGARAQPFFRPAFEATKHEVTDEMGKRVWSQISSSIIKLLAR